MPLQPEGHFIEFNLHLEGECVVPDKTSNKSRILDRQQTTYGKFLRLLPIPLGLLALLCIVIAGNAILAPLEIEEVAATHTLKQEVAFDYTAIPRVSTLYPNANPLGKQPAYLVNLTDQFRVNIRCNISAPEGAEVHGTHKISMQLDANGLWSKEYVLSQEKPFSGSGSFTAFDLPLSIPIHELLAFSTQVGKEAATNSGSYKLTITPKITAEATSDNTLLVNDFTPSFTFELSNILLTPKGLPKDRYVEDADPKQDLLQTNLVSQPITQIVPNHFPLFGGQLTIPAARVLFICVSLVLIYAVSTLTIYNYRRQPQLSAAEKIQKRYSSRLVDIKYGALGLGTQQLQLGNFQALLTIADEREKPILHATNLDGVKNGHIYYLIDDNITYSYFLPEGPDAGC